MASSCWCLSACSAYVQLPQDACSASAVGSRCAWLGSRHGQFSKASACTFQAVLAESEAKRSAHAQELEDIRASREHAEAALAQAEARLEATQAALAEVMQPDLSCDRLTSGWGREWPSVMACLQDLRRSATGHCWLLHVLVHTFSMALEIPAPEALVVPRLLPWLGIAQLRWREVTLAHEKRRSRPLLELFQARLLQKDLSALEM